MIPKDGPRRIRAEPEVNVEAGGNRIHTETQGSGEEEVRPPFLRSSVLIRSLRPPRSLRPLRFLRPLRSLRLEER